MIIKKIVTGIVALAIVSTMAVTTALATTSATKERGYMVSHMLIISIV